MNKQRDEEGDPLSSEVDEEALILARCLNYILQIGEHESNRDDNPDQPREVLPVKEASQGELHKH